MAIPRPGKASRKASWRKVGHGFDPPAAALRGSFAEDCEAAAKFFGRGGILQLLESFKGEPLLTGSSASIAVLQATEVLAQGLQPACAYGLGNNRQRIGAAPGPGLEPEAAGLRSVRTRAQQLLPSRSRSIAPLLQGRRWGRRAGPSAASRGAGAVRRSVPCSSCFAGPPGRGVASCSCWCCWRHWAVALRPAPPRPQQPLLPRWRGPPVCWANRSLARGSARAGPASKVSRCRRFR